MTTERPAIRPTRTGQARPAEPPRPADRTGSAGSHRPADSHRPAESHRPGDSHRAVVAVRRLFAAETPEYFLLLGTTLFLVLFGLVMVLSSSSIEAGAKNGDFFSRFVSQATFALIGLPLMLLFARMPARFWQRWAWHLVAIGVGLQLLVFVPGLSYAYGGNQNWLRIGGFTAQPSELVKLALVVWLGTVLARKRAPISTWRQMLLPVVPVAGVAIALVLVGKDLGTAMIMFAIVLGALFFAGARLRLLLGSVVVTALIAWLISRQSTSRQDRIAAFLDGCQDVKYRMTECYQTLHGWWALADGGVFGVGLGNSRGKWSWIPEADSDFIFSIIGEELGLVGAVVVLLLFGLLAFSFVRIIRMQRERFPMIVTAAVLVWVIGQAFINIAVVLGLLPVLGLPLPLISKGGTALITTLAAIGIVLSFARRRPEDPAVRGAASAARPAVRR